jgi:UDP-3-O-acyl-N-acetylglucosamine deacetylase
VAHRGGHALHTAFAAHVLEETSAWTLVSSGVDPTPTTDAPVAVPVTDAIRVN